MTDEWQQAEQDLHEWRDQGFTVEQFKEGCRTLYNYHQDFTLPDATQPEPCPPGWEPIWEDHRAKRQRLRELLDQGYFPFQAVNAAGLGPDASMELTTQNEELATQNKHQHDSIVRQAAAITRLQDELKEARAQIGQQDQRRRREPRKKETP